MKIKNIKITAVLLLAILSIPSACYAADMKRGQKGESTGIVMSKGQKWIEILQEGVIKRYIPFGILPEDTVKQDSRLAKEMAKIRVNSRVQVGWEFQKYLRIVSIKRLDK